jgi:hypothetical protein
MRRNDAKLQGPSGKVKGKGMVSICLKSTNDAKLGPADKVEDKGKLSSKVCMKGTSDATLQGPPGKVIKGNGKVSSAKVGIKGKSDGKGKADNDESKGTSDGGKADNVSKGKSCGKNGGKSGGNGDGKGEAGDVKVFTKPLPKACPGVMHPPSWAKAQGAVSVLVTSPPGQRLMVPPKWAAERGAHARLLTG